MSITVRGQGVYMELIKEEILRAIADHEIIETTVELLTEEEPANPWLGPRAHARHRVVGKRIALVLGRHIAPETKMPADPFAVGGRHDR